VVEQFRLRHHPVGMSVQIGQHVEGPGAERKLRTIETRHAPIALDFDVHLRGALSRREPKRCTAACKLSNVKETAGDIV
jgi:hypothetical protein